jgi:hypothetical protein
MTGSAVFVIVFVKVAASLRPTVFAARFVVCSHGKYAPDWGSEWVYCLKQSIATVKPENRKCEITITGLDWVD